jgi:chromosome segregation protein
MIQFNKLRLSGFKSFVDKTELEIGPGLNGIVGPNGCGKSNLVEALRWVMGESSAKRMRGDGMEDVIFAGTNNRSSRYFAEVSLLLDNSKRAAPAAYNSSDEIEVIRRIEIDKGSDYKINGKNARARDVQMLFADTVTGANSPSLVSQGHVTRMISAKPQDRRLILEESAGIAGLYARRHEAELRLRAADTNLIRLEDILGSMESRLSSLKRQSRLAIKYKNLSASIRELEIQIAYLEWLSLKDKQTALKTEFAQSESLVAENMAIVTQLTKAQNGQIGDLPPLRKKEAEAAASLQKQKIDFQNLEDEIERYLNDLQETKTQLHQLSIDHQHEAQTLEDTASQLEKVEGEYKEILSEQERDEVLSSQKSKLKETTNKELLVVEERYSALKENAAANMARKESLEKQIQRHESRISSLKERLSRAQDERKNCTLEDNINDNIAAIEKQCAEKENELIELKIQQEENALSIDQADQKREKVRNSLNTAENNYAKICAELSALEEFLDKDDGDSFSSVLDQITTDAGFEKALSRALGDSLMAALDKDAPAYWAGSNGKESELPALPKGVSSMLSHVKAPKELDLALASIGYVDTTEQGASLANKLKSGQSLVSADGAYWRWDGFIIQEVATDRHSVYLEQKNKKASLEINKQQSSAELNKVRDEFEETCFLYDSARIIYDEVTSTIKSYDGTLSGLRPKLQKLKDKTQRVKADQERYAEQITSLEEDINATQDVLENDQNALKALIEVQEDGDNNDALIAQVKEKLDAAKEDYQHAVRDLDLFTQGCNTRRARIQAIADERLSLKNRNIRAGTRLKELSERQNTSSQKLQALNDNPIIKDNIRADMLDKISVLEKQRNRAAELLAACEENVAETNSALKDAENILGSARERRAQAQAFLTSLNEQLSEVEKAVQEKFDIRPNDLIKHIEAGDLINYGVSDLSKLKEQKDSCVRERDLIGPVNLRAEIEVKDLEEELTTLLHDRQDLSQAIDELRGGINKINKEARERLLSAFKLVNAHFQDLFKRLFSGGEAYLELVDSADPLGAGLEIFAKPPGKSLQSLSLLSGGEQTLASIALIFAMFLTNPSPICVLDEIDAPLDDANVDRVCDLLDEIAERGETRFLVITHHRLSMARMDRLYGVTMSEKGVSQLLSIDLQRSFDFAEKSNKDKKVA